MSIQFTYIIYAQMEEKHDHITSKNRKYKANSPSKGAVLSTDETTR